MDVIEYYKVTVKVEVDTGQIDKKGNPKMEKHKEVYLVKDCGSAQKATAIVEDLFKDCTDEWAIVGMKAEKFDDIISAKS